jgi:hypothetical protein
MFYKWVKEFYKGFKEVRNIIKECIKDKGVYKGLYSRLLHF